VFDGVLAKRLPRRDPPAERVLEHHAATLGLAALILACPYTVPPWLPAVLADFAAHLNGPPPIQVRSSPSLVCRDMRASRLTRALHGRQATVRKTVAEFRRTHQDTWHRDRLAFSDDQLAVLSELLVSPNYYA
jgi:proteasome activator subunit 4